MTSEDYRSRVLIGGALTETREKYMRPTFHDWDAHTSSHKTYGFRTSQCGGRQILRGTSP